MHDIFDLALSCQGLIDTFQRMDYPRVHLLMEAHEVTLEELKEAIGSRVEILAFGITYTGFLKKMDIETGTVQIRDKGDYAILEIERIESFRILRPR